MKAKSHSGVPLASQTQHADPRTLAQSEIEAQRADLIALSSRIHDNPELGYQETRAAKWLTEYLAGRGFQVEAGICGLPTAFRATYGSGRPHLALLAEYDALPEIGHGCGHNVIAGTAVGAACAAKHAADHHGGTIFVLGTPAEELYGGKTVMVRKGCFDELDAAMLVHPGNRNIVATKALACVSLEVEFWGKAAHAAARPDEGINALDAMIQSFNAVNALRQHIKPSARIHGIVTDGGQAANIVPSHSAGSFLVRAEDEAYLDILKERVLDCFRAASIATGARLQYSWGDNYYAPLRSNRSLAKAFARNMEFLGQTVDLGDSEKGFGSTDMGNVSQMVPSIHPFVKIAPHSVVMHSAEFAALAAGQPAWEALLVAAKALALTVCDLLADSRLRARVRRDFQTGHGYKRPGHSRRVEEVE